MAAGEPILWSLYVYAPNKGGPIFFTIAYFVSAVFHTWQCYRYKAFKLVGLHPACALMFTAGYALREYGAFNYLYDPNNNLPLMTFIMSQIFIYICPPLLELANYHVLGRLFYYVPYCSPLPPGKILAIFGGLMVLVETLNGMGVSFSANATSTKGLQKMGGHLSIASLVLQLGLIITFFYLAVVFHRRCLKAKVQTKPVKTVLCTLYGSMSLIFIRCIYRLVEHTGNTKLDLDSLEALRTLSPILRFEAFFYIFEASLMLINSALWNIWHPGRFLPKDYHVFLGPNGTEIVGEEDADNRPLLAKTANILSFGIFYRHKRHTQQFHQLSELSTTHRRDDSDAPATAQTT